MAEVLIPDPITAVTGRTSVSPTAQVEELILPMVAVMFWALPILIVINNNKRTCKKTKNFLIIDKLFI
jgi:hypothetical protein